MFTSVLSVILLGSIGQTTALALFRRQQHQANTALTLDKRQGTVLVTRFSTIFSTGDSSKPRTANTGFDCRVDLLHSVWGFCPSTVIAATDCGLAGSCVDSFSCSDGCGLTDTPLTTFTCSEANAPFCSTALLTLSNNVGPFTYLACGKGPSTDEYQAFTTGAKPPGVTRPILRTSSSSSSSPSSASPSATASTLNPTDNTPSSRQPQSQSTPPDSTATPEAGAPPEPAQPTTATTTSGGNNSNSNSNNNSPNNTGAIIGGIFGCLALLCGCVVVVFWLRHRHRHRHSKNAAPAAAATTTVAGRTADKGTASDTSSGQGVGSDLALAPSPPGYSNARAEGLGVYPVAELSGKGPAAYEPGGDGGRWRVGVGYAPETPVELPGSGFR